VSLPLAKRLKELGVKQESYFAWYEERYEGDVQIEVAGQNDTGPFRFRDCAGLTSGAEHRTFYAAFTVAELGDLLPAVIPAAIPRWKSPTKSGYAIGIALPGPLKRKMKESQVRHTRTPRLTPGQRC
jgi:hypothetical protein